MTVYADVLVFINAIVSYFLILSVCAIFKIRPKTYRMLFGAVFGGMSAIVIFLPKMFFVWELVIKSTICVVQILITFSFKNKIRFAKLFLTLITVTYIFSGVVLSIIEISNTQLFIYQNGMAYFDISPMMLIISTAIVYFFIRVLLLFKKGAQNEEIIYECEVELYGIKVVFSGINDTGNSLLDPYFNTPVVIVEKEILEPILEFNPKTYLIPIKSIVADGVIFAFKPNSFRYLKDDKYIEIKQVTIGIANSKIHSQYSAILSPEIFELTEEEPCFSLK